MWVLHSSLDWDDETDTLKGKNCRSNKQRPVLAVEVLDIRNAMLGSNCVDVVVIKVNESKHDENIGDQSQLLDMVDVPVKRKREKNDHLHEDHVFDVNVSPTFGYCQNESLEILRHEDNIRGRKANLTDDKRKVDEIAHPLSVKNVAHFAKGMLHF